MRGSTTRVICALAVAWAATVGMRPYSAAQLPDWASALAARAPEAPEGVPEHRSRLLLLDRQYVVQPDGWIRVRLRSARQALSVEAQEAGVDLFPSLLGKTDRVRSRAWHVLPGQKVKKASRAASIDLVLDDAFLTDSTRRRISVDDVQRGSLIFFEFEALWRPYSMAFHIGFFEPEPVAASTVRIELPDDWSLEYDWLRADGPDLIETSRGHGSGKLFEVRFENLEPPEREPLSPPRFETTPLLVVGIRPPTEGSDLPPSFATWSDAASWFRGLAEDRAVVDDDIRAVLANLTVDGDKQQTIRAASRYVRDRVRYVATPIGIGGYQPRASTETLFTLWGDCKDKGTLLRALLAAEGVASYPVLVNATRRDMVSETVPSLAFDHMIVGVQLPPGEPDPEPSFAVADTEKLGRLWYIDTTDELTSVGWLHPSLSDQQVLIVAPEGGVISTLPAAVVSGHEIARNLEVDLQPGGAAVLRRSTRYYGGPARRQRALHRNSPRDRRKASETGIRSTWLQADIQEYRVEPETDDGSFHEQLSWTVPRLLRAQMASRLPLCRAFDRQVRRVSLTRRETAVVYPYPIRITYSTTVRGAAGGLDPPVARRWESDSWNLETTFEREAGEVRASCESTLRATRFEPRDFDELRLWYAALRAAGRTELRFTGEVDDPDKVADKSGAYPATGLPNK